LAASFLKPRVVQTLFSQRRVMSSVVVVSWEDEQRVRQLSELLQRVPVSSGVPTWQVRSAGAAFADEQEISGQKPVWEEEAQAVRGVTGRVEELDLQVTQEQRLALMHAVVGARRCRAFMHDVVGACLISKRRRAGDVVGVNVGIDHIPKQETPLGDLSEVVLIPFQYGIDEHGFFRLLVGDEIGLACGLVKLFENHEGPWPFQDARVGPGLEIRVRFNAECSIGTPLASLRIMKNSLAGALLAVAACGLPGPDPFPYPTGSEGDEYVGSHVTVGLRVALDAGPERANPVRLVAVVQDLRGNITQTELGEYEGTVAERPVAPGELIHVAISREDVTESLVLREDEPGFVDVHRVGAGGEDEIIERIMVESYSPVVPRHPALESVTSD
jgi:hypothetical protein